VVPRAVQQGVLAVKGEQARCIDRHRCRVTYPSPGTDLQDVAGSVVGPRVPGTAAGRDERASSPELAQRDALAPNRGQHNRSVTACGQQQTSRHAERRIDRFLGSAGPAQRRARVGQPDEVGRAVGGVIRADRGPAPDSNGLAFAVCLGADVPGISRMRGRPRGLTRCAVGAALAAIIPPPIPIAMALPAMAIVTLRNFMAFPSAILSESPAIVPRSSQARWLAVSR
jgi:hypothetical protein